MKLNMFDNDIEKAEQDREQMIQDILTLNNKNWSNSSLSRKSNKELKNILKKEQAKQQ